MYKFRVHQSPPFLALQICHDQNVREPLSHPSPTQESTKLQGSFVNLSESERQKQNFSVEEYMMINDCMRDKPSFVKWSQMFGWKKERLEKCRSVLQQKNICARVFAPTLVRFSNKRFNTLRLDQVNCAALQRCFMSTAYSLQCNDAAK